jgi:hypothetical protein
LAASSTRGCEDVDDGGPLAAVERLDADDDVGDGEL